MNIHKVSQHYADLEREDDPHSLPDVEIFRDSSSSDDEWYWWFCLPGCLPDSEPYGPFESFSDAYDDFEQYRQDHVLPAIDEPRISYRKPARILDDLMRAHQAAVLEFIGYDSHVRDAVRQKQATSFRYKDTYWAVRHQQKRIGRLVDELRDWHMRTQESE